MILWEIKKARHKHETRVYLSAFLHYLVSGLVSHTGWHIVDTDIQLLFYFSIYSRNSTLKLHVAFNQDCVMFFMKLDLLRNVKKDEQKEVN